MGDILSTSIKYLKGVGDVRARLLEVELGIFTFHDLAYCFPYRYVDRSRFYMISELHGNDMPALQIRGRFVRFHEDGEGARKRLVGVFTDGRQFMETVWFSKIKAIASIYRENVDYVIFGKPVMYYGKYSIAHPEIEIYDAAKPPHGLRGLYSLTETLRKKGITVRKMRELAEAMFSIPAMSALEDPLPAEIVARYGLMPFAEAIREMHFPVSEASLTKAIERMKFEELFYVELHILRFARRRGSRIVGHVFGRIGENFNRFYSEVLPFELTGAQKRVLKEIRNDMRTGRQMNRLLQGDVGCGKTMVAFMSMLMALDNGFQATIMAPTEILAGQHYAAISEWAGKIGVKTGLLTGSVRTVARREIHEGLADGSLQILVGTHALIEENVVFRNLGLAVIDEQHRFGVAQRAKMWKKGVTPPHVLVMTATPIPRTLAMTVYGDLEVSVIDELPPGRKPVETFLRYDDNRMEVDRMIFSQLREGRQIYIVYPLIHENEKLSLKSLEEGRRRVEEVFGDWRICYVHGQMKPAEKDHQMDLFVRGEARIMVATTVIEVGVNVPNASVMIIENAERFGLSQLHQLRGRVGRGADKSYCVLMTHKKASGDTMKRLHIMTETDDGFLISEADMKIRGPGDMEGTQQSGLAFNLKVASLVRDGEMISRARKAALDVLASNPGKIAPADASENGSAGIVLSEKSIALLARQLSSRFDHAVDWSDIS